jgi:hypothetical protein
MAPFWGIEPSRSTRHASANRQEIEDSREENGVQTIAIGAKDTKFRPVARKILKKFR